jgi:DNA-directed RNA polymerase subunit RPC12/RpoP
MPSPGPDFLLSLQSRGEIRRWGRWLDEEGAPTRAALVATARARGADVPDDWEDLDGKRLLKACLDRSEDARRRLNPISIDEAFVCACCGFDVPEGGRRPRDHCPRCLHSLHLDVVPGDRAAGCGGLLVPLRTEPSQKGTMIVFRCARCGIERRNRVLDDVEAPDDLESLRKLVVRTRTLG